MNIRRAMQGALMAGLLSTLLSGYPQTVLAQSMRYEDLAQGKILVTPRDSPDPHFANSVIVLARYGTAGALGLMLHYKSDLSIQKALSGLKEPGPKATDKRNDTLYVGGPVEIPTILALVRVQRTPAGGALVTGNLYLMTSKQSIAAALSDGRQARDTRVFIGYAGWAAGQLEREVRRSGWFIFDYDESLVFDDHPDTLWDRMIQKTERRLAILTPPVAER